MLHKSTVQTFASGVLAPVAWDGVEYERIGRWDAGEPTRIYVPDGVRYARASAGLSMNFFYDASPAVLQFRIRKNGTNLIYGCAGSISMFTSYAHTLANVSTPWLAVEQLDFFDAAVYHGCASDNTCRTTGFSWMAVEFWEPS